MSGAPLQPQLRILAGSTSASSNVTTEQDPTALFEQMAQLFQLTPLPKRRLSMMSPSVVAIDALLDDIGDPQRLLHEMVVAAQVASSAPEQGQQEHVQPQARKKQRKARTGKAVVAVLEGDKNQPPQAAKKTRAPRKRTASTAPTVLARLRKAREATGDASTKSEKEHAAVANGSPRAHLSSDSDELSMGSYSPSSTSKNSTMNAVRANSGEAMVNTSRARQKEETAHLRVKVAEFQAQLLKLGNRSKTPACRGATSASATHNNNKQVKQVRASRLGSLRTPIWERIANSAKDHKHRSEVENLRLRETVEMQAKLSKSLEKILMKRANLALTERFSLSFLQILGMPSPPTPSCPASRKRLRAADNAPEEAVSALTAPQKCSDDDDACVFDELSSQLDHQYACLDDVHRETGLDQRTAEWQCCEVVDSNNSSDPLLVERCDIKLYPFSVDAVLQAAWRCATVTAIKDVNYISEIVLQTESVAHTKTTITIKKPNTPELVLSVKSVVKRFTEPHRRVFLLNSVTSVACRLIQLGAGWVPSPADLEIRDQGWATIESISDDERWPGSISRVCMRARPVDSQQMKQQSGLAEGDAKASGMLALSNLLVDTCNQVMRARQQVVENFLLEAEIARRS